MDVTPKEAKRGIGSHSRPELKIDTDLKPHIVSHNTSHNTIVQVGKEDSDDDPEVIFDQEFEDVYSTLCDNLFLAHKYNDWGDAVYDKDTKSWYISRNCGIIDCSLDPTFCQIIPSSNTLAHRISQFFIMDGVIEALPQNVTKDEFEKYLYRLNLFKITERNMFLARESLCKGFEDNSVLMMPSKYVILRLIKLAESAAVEREESLCPFPEGFNCTKWVSIEHWMNPAKGLYKDAPLDIVCFGIKMVDDKEVKVPLYEYQLVFYKKMDFFRCTYKEVLDSNGNLIDVQDGPRIDHRSPRYGAPPFKHTPPIEPFLLPLDPVFVIVRFIYSVIERQALEVDDFVDKDGLKEIRDTFTLCQYFIRLATSDHASQFREFALDRPSSIPFDGPAVKSKRLYNYIKREKFPSRSDWTIPLYSSSPSVDNLMTYTLKETMPPKLWDQLYNYRCGKYESTLR